MSLPKHAKCTQMIPNAIKCIWSFEGFASLVCLFSSIYYWTDLDSLETLSHFSPIKAASPDTPSPSRCIPWDLNNRKSAGLFLGGVESNWCEIWIWMNSDVQQRYEALNARLMCLIILSMIYLAPVKAPFLCWSLWSICYQETTTKRGNNWMPVQFCGCTLCPILGLKVPDKKCAPNCVMTSSSRDSKIVPCAMSGNMATLILKYQFLLSHCCLAKASWSAEDLLTPLTPFFWAKILMLRRYLGKPAKIDCSCTRSCKGFTGAKHLAKSGCIDLYWSCIKNPTEQTCFVRLSTCQAWGWPCGQLTTIVLGQFSISP